MAHDVFVCYSSEDKTIANAACAKLESAGIRCWMAPRDPIAGIPYGRQLVDAITAARIVLLIFSGNANRSEHVLRELEVASDSGKIIVPFRIENVTPSGDLRYYITRVHWLDAMSPPMESRLNELVALMQRLLELPVTPLAAAVAATSTRKPYPAWAAIVVIASALVIALSLYFMKRSSPPTDHAIAKATPQPKHTAAPVARRSAHIAVAAITPPPPTPPAPVIVYVPQPQGTAVRLTVVPNVPRKTAAPENRVTSKRATPAPQATAAPTVAPTTAAPTTAPLVATRPPTSVEYRTRSQNLYIISRMDETSWRLGTAPNMGPRWTTAGRAVVAGTPGTALSSPNGREWLFVPDLGANGPFAHQICFSLAGPGVCDANKIMSIVSEH